MKADATLEAALRIITENNDRKISLEQLDLAAFKLLSKLESRPAEFAKLKERCMHAAKQSGRRELVATMKRILE